MSKDDFNSKVGKSALSGLLNIKKPEPVKIEKYDPAKYEGRYQGYQGGDAFGGYDDDMFGAHHRRETPKFESSYKKAGDVTTHQPAWQQGEKSAVKGSGPRKVKYVVDGGKALLGENEIRHIKVSLRQTVLDALRPRGIYVKMGEDHYIDEFIEDLLTSGTCQVKKPTGVGFLTIRGEEWGSDND
jgi:hypothetical protein